MLVLTISPDDPPIHVRVPGRPDILVYLTAIRGGGRGKVRLGFEAERDINIVRGAALARGGHDGDGGDRGGDGNHGGKGHRGGG